MTDPILLPDKFTPDSMAELVDTIPMPSGDVAVDASQVATLTSPGLQTLISIARTTRSAGYEFTILSMSDAFADDLTLLGLDPEAALEDAT